MSYARSDSAYNVADYTSRRHSEEVLLINRSTEYM